jgi:hypothetical protein
VTGNIISCVPNEERREKGVPRGSSKPRQDLFSDNVMNPSIVIVVVIIDRLFSLSGDVFCVSLQLVRGRERKKGKGEKEEDCPSTRTKK